MGYFRQSCRGQSRDESERGGGSLRVSRRDHDPASPEQAAARPRPAHHAPAAIGSLGELTTRRGRHLERRHGRGRRAREARVSAVRAGAEMQ